MRALSTLIVAALLSLGSITASEAADCQAEDFAKAVDQSGAGLRAFTIEAQPKLQDRMRRYKDAKKLSDEDFENAALDAVQDEKFESLDKKSGELLLKIDELGRVPSGTAPDCAKLDEIKAASAELLTVIKAKSDYMLASLDQKITEAGGASVPPPKPVAPPAPAKAEAAKADPPKTKEPRQQTAVAKPAPPQPARPPDWSANTKPNDAYVSPAPDAAQTMPDVTVDNSATGAQSDGYSIDEVRDATRGFFGTISTSLASVIEHAFKSQGRPTAYVLGTEGGGAFFAGLRFGKGTLFMRAQPETRQVYWHGPSLGSDFGASGSRTMFLIYKMQEPQALYRNFTGIDGSAYFVGGVGVTLLKGGEVLMAPIRSGLGLRLGANVGYLRFTQNPTWNPF